MKCNAKVTQSVLVVDELALRVCWGEGEFGTQLVTARPKGLLDWVARDVDWPPMDRPGGTDGLPSRP